MNKRNFAFSLAAGLLGGVVSHYLSSPVVNAETYAPVPKEIRAESFLLVNGKGVVIERLANDGGRPSVRLFDERGEEIWSAGGKNSFRAANLGR